MTNTPATEVADRYLGNVKEDNELAAQVAQSRDGHRCLEVTIERKDCRKGRIFTKAVSGQAVGIVKGRDWQLRDGDVLRTQGNYLVSVRLQAQEVIALQFDSAANNASVQLVNLGHTIGNHHWPIALHKETLYVEAAANAKEIEATIREIALTLGIKGLHIACESREGDRTLDFSTNHSSVHTHAH
ncbi:hypothetical protein S7335_3993 [Synechococcus sp. PCC 7335]|uniref:hypothetical protein n=1 Tax=Synechococcus sp. (strain ATCC 29403 / PCC 7335) TaxID=91464 RepID=UPI00017ED5F8|nr:hypothetical protein [Synechococcus sp. PCC 7335]EDX86290.1 hypothetical protein S7335_3993 [Synechococcus sp. PCC 7335]